MADSERKVSEELAEYIRRMSELEQARFAGIAEGVALVERQKTKEE